MHNYRFEKFQFDSRRLQLRRNNVPVTLRPKTALLLRELLLSRGSVSGKRDLVVAVWGTPHVSDQNLFQAVSELRRALAPLQPIVTHPNRGYAWTEAASTVSPGGGARRLARAAGLAGVAAAAALALLADDHRAAPAAAVAQPLPALHALSNGMSSLRNQRFAEAERQFVLALAANPQFHEARLLLAETWLAQGNTTRARAMAAAMLDTRGDADAYVTVAAMDLLSRSSTLDGTHEAALEWARSAADGARNSGFTCAAFELEDRIATLASGTRRREPDPVPRHSPVLAEASAAQPAYCQQIHREVPDTGQLERAPRAPARLHCRLEVPLITIA